jgi:hypothetical protein
MLYPLNFALFMTPGLVPALLLVRRQKWPVSWAALLAVVGPATAGVFVFWAYFLHPVVGRVASAAVLLISAGCLVALVRCRPLREMASQPDVFVPLALMFLITLVYFGFLGILFTASGGDVDKRVRDRFSNLSLAADDIIPALFAEHLYAGTDPREILGDWHSSDRPPLQTGLVLVQRPLADYCGPPLVQYHMLGTIFQCTWVVAVWALGRKLGLNGGRLALVFAFCTTASFFFFHSLYVWPKLLAGTLTIVPVVLLVRQGPPAGLAEVLVAALAAGLALLAHPGSAFTLLAVALFLLRPSRFPGIGKVLAGMAVCVALQAPWVAYQRWYDPPGDRLLKWHMAGVIDIDERPSGQTVRDAYSSISPLEIAGHKWANLQALCGRPLFEPTLRGTTWRAVWKNGEYYNLLKALGVLNVGWLVLAFTWFSNRADPGLAELRTLMALAVLGLAGWLLLMFGPGTTMIYQGAFATVILLFVGLATAVSRLPNVLVGVLLAIQVLDIIIIWLIP